MFVDIHHIIDYNNCIEENVARECEGINQHARHVEVALGVFFFLFANHETSLRIDNIYVAKYQSNSINCINCASRLL